MLLLTDAQGREVYVNLAHIVSFIRYPDNELTNITLTGDGSLRVAEVPAVINQRIDVILQAYRR
jgi:hypothetical protein